VKWLARGPGYQLFLTSGGVTMMVQDGGGEPPGSEIIPSAYQLPRTPSSAAKPNYRTLQMKLTGSRPWKNVAGLEPTGGTSNYFLGNDPKAWHTNVPHYARVNAASVYDGIDLVFYDHGGNLEYDFVVAPGADPKQIRLAFEGQDEMHVDRKSGDLVLTAGGIEMRQVRPRVYQQIGNARVEVAGAYEMLDRGRASFLLAAYDRQSPLVIDPTVSFTMFLGGSDTDQGHAVAVDSLGNSYVAGSTNSVEYPVNDASLQWDQPFYDAFVTKLSPSGAILFSTYLGGNGIDAATGIAVDSTGVYVTGLTHSTNFPHQNSKRNPSADVFVSKLFLDGNGITYTAIVGGSADDGATAIAVDPLTHAAYVTGWAGSADFPLILSNAPGGWRQFQFNGMTDAFVLELDASGSLYRSVLMGGTNQDIGTAIALDHLGDTWVTGKTCSPEFVATSGIRFPGTGPGTCTGFVASFDVGFDYLRQSTFWGIGYGVAVDANNNVFVTGTANTPAFSAIAGAFQSSPPNAGAGFITRFDISGLARNSTYLGGSDGTAGGSSIAVNSAGEVYVGGTTSSTAFPGATPLTPNPTAGFVSKLSADLSTLRYSKLLGADIFGVAVFEAAPPFGVPQILTTGDRYTGSVSAANLDAFVVSLIDDVDRSQVLWQNPASGNISASLLNSQGGVIATQPLSLPCATSDACSQIWKLVGTLDFNRDGFGDLLQYNAATGELRALLLNGSGAVTGTQSLSRWCGPSDGCSKIWSPVGVGDFNHDGIGDILWHNGTTGELQAWLLDGAGGVKGTLSLAKRCAVSDGCWATWQIVGIGDFNHDGIDDVFWQNVTTGLVGVWEMNGAGGVTAAQNLAKSCGPSDGCSTTWKAVGVADVDKDGFGDLLWENVTTGELSVWLLNGTDRLKGTQSLPAPCVPASGCSAGSQPVTILRDYHVTP
jgi:hypothetical protein